MKIEDIGLWVLASFIVAANIWMILCLNEIHSMIKDLKKRD